MRSRTSPEFRKRYRELPPTVRRDARKAYQLFRADPRNRGLDFKRVHTREPMYSARVGEQYRAVASRDGDTWVWFWIGPHAEYDQRLRRS